MINKFSSAPAYVGAAVGAMIASSPITPMERTSWAPRNAQSVKSMHVKRVKGTTILAPETLIYSSNESAHAPVKKPIMLNFQEDTDETHAFLAIEKKLNMHAGLSILSFIIFVTIGLFGALPWLILSPAILGSVGVVGSFGLQLHSLDRLKNQG